MDRNELKGKQTPGDWLIDADFTVYALNGGSPAQNRMWAHVQPGRNIEGSWISHSERAATAALISEAGTVANRTGMWPEDMEARIKELEDALRMFLDGVGASDLGDACDNARAILNKR